MIPHPIVQPDILLRVKSMEIRPAIEMPRSVPVIELNSHWYSRPPPSFVPLREPVLREIPLIGHSYHKNTPSVLNYDQRFTETLRDMPKKPLQSRLEVRPKTMPISKSDGRSVDSGLSGGTRSSKITVIQGENHELAIRLHEILLQFPYGVMEKSLPDVFQKATGKSLPDHWTTVVATYSRFFNIELGPLAHIVYAKEIDEMEVASSNGEESNGKLQLPWDSPHWNVYVTHAMSTCMIWGRLIGPANSDRWDTLMAEIEIFMSNAANRSSITELLEQELYLVRRQSAWYRVRCQEIDSETNRFLALFVDQGMEEWLPIESVFLCEDKFTCAAVPGQAIVFSLLGLESMEDNPHAKAVLDRTLQGQSIVAEIRTMVEDYIEGDRIKAIFYDTSSEEDLNLVDTLQEAISAAAKPPQLKTTGLNHVTVTHVSDRGEIFCQAHADRGMEYVKRLIDGLVQTKKELMARHRGLNENLGDRVTRYLVYDRVSATWHRAVLKVRHPQTGDHLMHCLDTGDAVKAMEHDIYVLAPLSVTLNRYPAQCIRCVLFNIPKLQQRLVDRIRGLLQPKTVALAKVIVIPGLDKVPQISLYQRLEADNNRVIVCINETLRIESDLESCAG